MIWCVTKNPPDIFSGDSGGATDMTDKRSILTIIIVMALWITASTMDYGDEVQAETEYCRHVSEGLWPDYRGIFEEVCDAD